jgi:predicted enzyme related to lactoylglutathione lyase
MTHLRIDYVEFASPDLDRSRTFFEEAFGWSFTDYGPNYYAMNNAGLDGGITSHADDRGKPPLVILKTDDLEAALEEIEDAGGAISRPIFAFPGGRRFHFREPGGNELAVWSRH